MQTLFDATTLRGKHLKNRLIRSATWERMADEAGRITPRLAAVYETLARGGVGGIITSATVMSPRSKALPGQIGLCDASYVPGHRQLTDAAHAAGAVSLLQLVYVGLDNIPETADTAAAEELDALPELFARAVGLAREAGYDGAQVHAAHGYLFSQFLNPAANTRTDRYGGDADGRCTLLLAVHDAMRREAGDDFLLGVKLDCRDMAGSAGVFESCLHVSRKLDAAGIDLVEISGLGGNRGLCGGVDQEESVFRDEAAAVAAAIEAPVMLVGANRSPATMTRILRETPVRYLALSRPLLREPDIVARWQDGSEEPSACLSCGGCYDDTGNRCLFAD